MTFISHHFKHYLKHYRRAAFIHLSALLCLIAFTAHQANAGEKVFTAIYASEYSGMDIEITRTLEFLGNNQYSYNFDADSALARIKESSRFTLVKGQYQPASYNYEKKVFGFGGKESIKFNWESKQADYYKGGKKLHRHSIEQGVLDSSLYQLQLQRDLFHQQQSFSYRYIQRDKIKERSFRVTGNTTFTVGDKTYPALSLKRDSNDATTSTEIIVIPELYYLIAQIEQEKDGSTFQTRLKQVNLNAEKLAKLYQ